MNILIVEDEPRAAKLLRKALTEEDHRVDIAQEGETGEKMATSGDYDLLVLDWLLPKRDGLTICRSVRAAGIDCRILMLTARDAIEDRISGLDSGADDYLVKPFALGEFLARIRALLRRENSAGLVLRAGSVTVDMLARRVTCGDIEISLTLREFSLLEYLMRNQGRTLTRSMIADNAWGTDVEGGTNVVDVYINFLRNKAEDLRGLIQTVRGEGYRLGDPT